jgi:hypothetical protein
MGEEAVGIDFAHSLLDGLGTEGTSDLLEGKKFMGRCIFDEVYVGKTTLAVVSNGELGKLGIASSLRQVTLES